MGEERENDLKKTSPPPMGNQQPGNRGNNNTPPNRQGGPSFDRLILFFLIGLAITMLLNNFIGRAFQDAAVKQISYSEFMDRAKEGKVQAVNIDETEGKIYIYPSDKDTDRGMVQAYYTGIIYSDTTLTEKMEEYGVELNAEIPTRTSSIMDTLVSWVIVPLIIFWFLSFIMRKASSGMPGMGGMGAMGKSRAKEYVAEGPKVTFKDVAGQDEAKESLMEIVDYLNKPEKYKEVGAKLPKGALLVGPPGTGKTLLAKAVAGEAGVPFLSLAGSDFVEMFVGVGASRVRDLFKEAQKLAPCIIFIDEIDAIGKSRDSRYGSGGNDEREQTLNQLLAEMDGFDTSKGILLLAATNRPEVLDKALLRPGRFDRRIIVDKPDQKGRLDTLKVHSKDVHMDETVDLEALALATAGLVGSDLANMINEAAIIAVKNGRQFVNQKDLFEANEHGAVGGNE